MPRIRSATNSVQKACRVLCALGDPSSRKLKDIAAATGIDKASILRVMNDLIKEGLVHRNSATKSYGYGVELYAILASLRASTNLRALTRPSLVRLAALTGDSVMLMVRSGKEAICLDRENGDFPVQAGGVDVGSRRPLASGSGSLALIAWLAKDEAEALLMHVKPNIARRYPRLPIAVLRNEIKLSRERGYTLLANTVVDHIAAIARPIFGPAGETLGSLCVSGLSKRIIPREKMLAKVLAEEVDVVEGAMRLDGDERPAAPVQRRACGRVGELWLRPRA